MSRPGKPFAAAKNGTRPGIKVAGPHGPFTLDADGGVHSTAARREPVTASIIIKMIMAVS